MALTLTIAFSSHRPETLPAAEKLMADHDHIVIEEPPTPEFRQMLDGTMSVAAFLQTADYEFPAFAEASCRMLRRLHQAGKGIHPCEPFMTRLVRIHEDFARGVRPADLPENGRRWPVYQAERDATGRLLAFYRATAAGDFDAMVKTACAFAAADAARFVLRDRLRAGAIADLRADLHGRVYVEAGYLHLRLLRELRHRLPTGISIAPTYLLGEVYRAAGHHSHLYNPGDLLTLAMIFDRPPAMARQRLLAARSLVYNELAFKGEVSPDEDGYPDAHADLAAIQYVNQLAYADCRRLYGHIAGLDPGSAWQAATGLIPAESNEAWKRLFQ